MNYHFFLGVLDFDVEPSSRIHRFKHPFQGRKRLQIRWIYVVLMDVICKTYKNLEISGRFSEMMWSVNWLKSGTPLPPEQNPVAKSGVPCSAEPLTQNTDNSL